QRAPSANPVSASLNAVYAWPAPSMLCTAFNAQQMPSTRDRRSDDGAGPGRAGPVCEGPAKHNGIQRRPPIVALSASHRLETATLVESSRRLVGLANL